MNQPFLPLFFGDFLASTAEWNGEERALYLLCLAYQWSAGSLPVEPKRLQKLVDFEHRTFTSSWERVSTKFLERDGRLYNIRLETHREKSKEISKKRSVAGANGAAKRWQVDSTSHDVANGNEIAIAKGLPSHPSHPIPSKIPVGEAEPPDADKALWDLGIGILGESNRSMLGKLVKDHGRKEVAAKVGELAAMSPRPVDPKAWLIACLRPREDKPTRFKTA